MIEETAKSFVKWKQVTDELKFWITEINFVILGNDSYVNFNWEIYYHKSKSTCYSYICMEVIL